MDNQVGKLMVALGPAIEEIHHPSAARAAGGEYETSKIKHPSLF